MVSEEQFERYCVRYIHSVHKVLLQGDGCGQEICWVLVWCVSRGFAVLDVMDGHAKDAGKNEDETDRFTEENRNNLRSSLKWS